MPRNPASKRLSDHTRGLGGALRTRRTVDHSRRPHHDVKGRPLPPYDPENDKIPTDERGNPICNARLSKGKLGTSGNGRCQRHPMANGRCRTHGGATPVGAAHPNFKHGAYSVDLMTRLASEQYGKNLPRRLQDLFVESIDDPHKLELDNEIALLQTRLNELLQQLDVAGSAEAWDVAVQTKDDLISAIRNQDKVLQAQKLRELDALLNKGQDDYRKWNQIMALTERIRRVKETEIKRVQLAQETVTRSQLVSFLTQVGGILRDEISDPATLTRISNGIARLNGPAARSGGDPGDTNR